MSRVNRRGTRRRVVPVFALALSAVLAGTGCEGGLRGGPGSADAGGRFDGPARVDSGGGGDVDADPGGDRGLVLRFEPEDDVPGDLGGSWNVNLTSARLRLSDLVVVGDTAPGDERTQLESVPLAWGEGVEGDVDRAHLPLAPAGRYSRVEARLAELLLEGTLDAGEVSGPFRIELTIGSGWPFGFSCPPVEVMPGSSAILPVAVDLRRLVDAVPWGQVDPDGSDVRVVENGDAAVGQIEDDLGDVFDDPG